MNQMRGLLAGCGIVVAPGAPHLRRALAAIRGADDDRMSELLHRLLPDERPAAIVRASTAQYNQQIRFDTTPDDRAVQLIAPPGVGR